MISNSDSYYDIKQNRVAVRGFSYSDNAENSKILIYPGVLEKIYCITKDGRIYSNINNNYIAWSFRNGFPYVNLSCVNNGVFTLESFYIKDLMAYNFIANAESYLERGYHAVNVDGNPSNCNYENIRYINPSLGY